MSGEDSSKKSYEQLCEERSDDFRYLPLDQQSNEIRLLKIRGPFEDDVFTPDAIFQSENDPEFRLSNETTFVIKAKIEHYPLEFAPKFSALSYTWGDSTSNRPIFFPTDFEDINCEKFHRLKVSENLFQALRQLKRYNEDVEHLWVDAICINQADTVEKTWQVAQMWNIYQKASLLRIWLGPGTAVTNALMEEMQEVIHAQVLAATDENGLKLEDVRVSDTFRRLLEFQRLTELPYWKRAWVRQEISAANPDNIYVTFGRRTTNFRVLYYFVRGIKNVAQEQRNQAQQDHWHKVTAALASSPGYAAVHDALESNISERSRLVHILETWLRKIYLWGDGVLATEPRDLLFSLYGMTHWKENDDRERLRVDYQKPSRLVFTDLVEYWPRLITWRNDPYDKSGPDLNLPSFATDWRRSIRPVHCIKLPKWDIITEQHYNAGDLLQYRDGGGIQSTNMQFLPNGACSITLNGFIVDTIRDIGPVMLRNHNLTDGSTCRWWISQLEDLATNSHNAEDFGLGDLALGTATAPKKHAIISRPSRWRVPIMDIGVVGGQLKRAPDTYKHVYEHFLNLISGAGSGAGNDPTLREAIAQYAEIMLTACDRRRFFMSKNGLCGIGFPDVQHGDLIVVFPGLMVPLILRRGLDGKCRIVSDAFVQGIMHAETRGDIGGLGFQLQDFVIV